MNEISRRNEKDKSTGTDRLDDKLKKCKNRANKKGLEHRLNEIL